jgi:hypothetical protein
VPVLASICILETRSHTGLSLMCLIFESASIGGIELKRTPASNETGVRLKLVAGTVYGVDANSSPVTVSHWVYIPAKQGARKMRRIGILK